MRRRRAAARRHAEGARIVYKTFGTLNAARDNVIVYPTSYSAQHTDIEWLVDVRALPRSQPLLHRHPEHVHQRAVDLAVELRRCAVPRGDDLRQRHPAAPADERGVRRRAGEDGLWLVDGRAAGLSLGRAVRRLGRAHRRELRLGQDRAAQLRLPRGRAHRPCWPRAPRKRASAPWAASMPAGRSARPSIAASCGAGWASPSSRISWCAPGRRASCGATCTTCWPSSGPGSTATSRPTTSIAATSQMALAGIKARVLLMPSATDLYFQTDDNRGELPHLAHGQAGRDPLGLGPPRRQPAGQSRGRRLHRRPGDGAARVLRAASRRPSSLAVSPRLAAAQPLQPAARLAVPADPRQPAVRRHARSVTRRLACSLLIDPAAGDLGAPAVAADEAAPSWCWRSPAASERC